MSEIEALAGKFHLKSSKSKSRGWQILDRWKIKQEQNGDVWKQISEQPLQCYTNKPVQDCLYVDLKLQFHRGETFVLKLVSGQRMSGSLAR